MSELEDFQFFGRLVQRGHIRPERVEELIAAAKQAGISLPEMAVKAGDFEATQLARLRRLNGEDLPDLPGYELESILGRGGTAVVALARHKKTGKKIAIKALLPELTDNAEARRAFKREAELLIQLDHPNVVSGERVGMHQGRMLFLLEYIPGKSLLELLREGHEFDEDSALYVILQVARAIQYLSSQGVVHRDIKPDNVLLTEDNQVRLIDLGFAVSSGHTENADGGETTVGTVAYISPEQARGQGDVDVRSDIYSLGATLYQLVIGDLPFSGETNQEVMAAQILASLNSEVLKSGKISPHMHYFIEKMMAKEREIRYQSPAELIADIEEQIEGKKSLEFRPEPESKAPASPATNKYPSLKRRRRR